VEREPYLILGACNPSLAHAALEAEPELGTLLPCNAVVYQQHGETHIAAVDAERMLSIVGNDDLATTAGEVRRRLSNVVERAAQSSSGSRAGGKPAAGWSRRLSARPGRDEERSLKAGGGAVIRWGRHGCAKYCLGER
jgi:uncharacterized protein DUF302